MATNDPTTGFSPELAAHRHPGRHPRCRQSKVREVRWVGWTPKVGPIPSAPKGVAT
jgi:hypothetical protein